MNAHPSHFTLDRAALGAPLPADDAAHLAACARCAAVVAERRTPPVRPDWLDTVRPPAPPARRPALTARRWALLLPVAAAAALAIVLVPRNPVPGGDADAAGIRAKGVPQVAVYLKREEAVVTWDGRTALREGDRLRLGVRGGGHPFVSVASAPASAPPTLLYAGYLMPEGETLLPLAFRVDGAGGAEVLSVVVGTEPIPVDAHSRPTGADAGAGRWSTRITLPKERR